MRAMSDPKLSRLEAQLERLIEGAFAQLFSKSIRPQDIALQLSRAMENSLQSGDESEPRPIAPDDYVIRMNPDVHEHLLKRQPALASILSQHMVLLAMHAGYRLNHSPLIRVIADADLAPSELFVHANHIDQHKSATAVMERIDLPPEVQTPPPNAQIIVNGQQVIPLTETLVNIGRSRENHIVLNDPHVSRHHAQLRLRFGSYTLFDTSSQSGTLVNDVNIREHRLQPGDVIQIGKTRLVYFEDQYPADSQTGANTSIDL
jgi:hypothetical protein